MPGQYEWLHWLPRFNQDSAEKRRETPYNQPAVWAEGNDELGLSFNSDSSKGKNSIKINKTFYTYYGNMLKQFTVVFCMN